MFFILSEGGIFFKICQQCRRKVFEIRLVDFVFKIQPVTVLIGGGGVNIAFYGDVTSGGANALLFCKSCLPVEVKISIYC